MCIALKVANMNLHEINEEVFSDCCMFETIWQWTRQMVQHPDQYSTRSSNDDGLMKKIVPSYLLLRML